MISVHVTLRDNTNKQTKFYTCSHNLYSILEVLYANLKFGNLLKIAVECVK